MIGTLAFLAVLTLRAQTPVPNDARLPQEKELDVVDFQHVKDVLKKDGLMQEVRRKKEEVARIQGLRVEQERARHAWPSEDDFWPLASELWLVKNAPSLKWDFDRPEYGLEETFAQLLRTTGRIGKHFRILALDAPAPAHFNLPWTAQEYCLLFSVPFARTLDLSKTEISLLLLEEVLRADEGWPRELVRPAKLKELAGSNFTGAKPDLTPVFEVGTGLTDFLRDKGYSFQQQFLITKKMDSLLKAHPELWNAYVRLLGKIDRLVKGNPTHASYLKLFPSPEMQIRWLAPEDKPL
jgi:hypothetical protein